MYCYEIYLKNNKWVPFSTCCILIILDFGLSESEQKVYKCCMGSEFYTKLGIKIDTEGINVTHCGLVCLEFWILKCHLHVPWGKSYLWSV